MECVLVVTSIFDMGDDDDGTFGDALDNLQDTLDELQDTHNEFLENYG